MSSWRSMTALQVALVALLVCAYVELCTAAAFTPRSVYDNMQPEVTTGALCGHRLADALQLICRGRYNSYFKTKKSVPPDAYWAPAPQLPYQDYLHDESGPRFKRGIYNECCVRSCTVDQLMNYCAE